MRCKRLYNAVFLIFREDTNCNGGFSIPVRVTISTAHIWLNKAFCGLFFLRKFRLVRYLSAIADFSGIHALSLQLATVKKSKRSVHSFCHSRLCVLELMTIHVQSRDVVRVS